MRNQTPSSRVGMNHFNSKEKKFMTIGNRRHEEQLLEYNGIVIP